MIRPPGPVPMDESSYEDAKGQRSAMHTSDGTPGNGDRTRQDRAIETLMASMDLTQKVGQLNQRLLGWKAIERRNGRLVITDVLRREIDRWGGLGTLYGLFRADPWSGRHWGNGILPEERAEAYALVQETVLARGAHGIGALLSEEAPHGHQALGGTVLPTNLALGATFDPNAVREAERAVGAELAASGVHLALVSGLDIARDPRWGRCEECFGEDPLMASRMCEAIVTGMQGEDRSLVGHGGVAVVLKHLAAQGEAVGGRNGQSAVLGMHDLREIHLPPVEAGVKAGAWGFMAAYNDIDSLPCCANPWLLQDYLREKLGFDGIVMADGLAVDRLEPMAGSIPGAGRAALLAGVDVSLWDDGFTTLDAQADDEAVVAAVDRSLRRVLTLKARFGLLPDVGAGTGRPTPTRDRVTLLDGQTLRQARDHTRRLSLGLARECLTVVSGQERLAAFRGRMTDDGAGPVLVVGPFADDIACFLGDYTAPLPDDERRGVASLLRERLGTGRVVVSSDGTDVPEDLWRRAAAVVAVVGGTSERSYDSAFADNGAAVAGAVGTERGATCGEGVDLSDISLPWNQDALLTSVRAATDAMLATVAVCGRAHVLRLAESCSDVLLWAGYAGPFGPQAVTEALTDDVPVPGRLPVTLPAYSGAVPVRYNDRQSASGVYRDAQTPVLHPFSHGQGALHGVTVRGFSACDEGERVVVHCTLTCGDAPAEGSLELFARRIGGGRRVPRLAQLVDSVRCPLAAHESRDVEMTVPRSALTDTGDGPVRVLLWPGADESRGCELTLGGPDGAMN